MRTQAQQPLPSTNRLDINRRTMSKCVVDSAKCAAAFRRKERCSNCSHARHRHRHYGCIVVGCPCQTFSGA